MALDLDPVIHAPKRLEICAYLAVVEEAEFGVLRTALDVSDSVLSKHLRVLTEAGYATMSRRTSLGRARAWIALTPDGRHAYRDYVAALRRLLDGDAATAR
ncbi:transcriptional regulator [Plantibacter sp. Mn2098]|uniref:transcriptional regulator n=1 Tax=Plantibacter sp. Mn2098 TaxID=3395266 RepID=UPI003BE59F33